MVRSKELQIFFILLFFFEAIFFGRDKQVKINQNKHLSQGNVYLEKGITYYYNGDYSRALDMYDKALPFFKKTGNPVGQGNVYRRKGDIYFHIGEKSKALELYDKALLFLEKAGNPIDKGNVYLGKGQILFFNGDHPGAFEIYEKALSFFKEAGDPIGQGNVYYNKGYTYLITGENSKAVQMYDKALPFYEKAGERRSQGNVYLGKGYIYLITGENSKAVQMYDKALPFYEKAGDPGGQGNVYSGKGYIYLITGENSKAIQMYDKALPFFEKIGDPIGQGNVYLNKGDIYSKIGDNSRALEMYDKALPFFEKTGTPIGQGNLYKGKGDIYLRIGGNLKALEMYEKALSCFEKVRDLIGQGNLYCSKGDIYSVIGDNPRALEMYDQALLFYEKTGKLIGQGNVYKNKGEIYLRIGENSKALDMYDQALRFFKKTGDPIGQGTVYYSRGRIYSRINENSKALEMYDKALSFYEKAGNSYDQGNVYHSSGGIYSKIGENSKALEMYDKALLFYKKARNIESESNALHDKAKVLVKLGKKDEALNLFEKSITKLEKIRKQTAFSEMKKTFWEKVYEQFEEVAVFTLDNKYYDKGFKYVEAMRARIFLDRMAEGLVGLDKGVSPDLGKKRDNLVANLSLLSKEMHKSDGKKDEKKLLELKEQYRKVEKEFEDLLVKIRLNNPLYALVRYPQTITVRALQTEILKKGELLLHYFISPNKLYVFIISRESFNVVPITVKEKELNGIVNRYLTAVEENNPISINRYGKTLYQKLFKPLEFSLKNNNYIIIVPDGELAKIPFESFILDRKKSGQPVFFLEKYRVKYVQSASLLSILRQHYHRDNKAKSFIGFGDAVYDYDNFKQGKPEQGTITRSPGKGSEIRGIHHCRYSRAGGIMNRLLHSGEEVRSIARLFEKKSQRCAVYLREKACEEKAKSLEIKYFDFIHFACHGLLNKDFQSLVLSQLPPNKSFQDGYLTLNEIMNCDYNAKLVVLSACQTGTGKLERGEGIIGLTRAVMYAGTPAVIASLWKVDDTATKKLMVNFYRNILEKDLDKTEALRQAKLELLKSKNYSSPLYWSAFVMYGE